jgi:hypothetical protein
MTERGEDRLRGLFEAWRREADAAVPPFERFLKEQGGRSRPRPRRIRFLRLTAAAALAAVIVLGRLAGREAPPAAPSRVPVSTLASWKSPTDWLLKTPGREMLDSVPALGRVAHGDLKLPDLEKGDEE